jgi:hypothetical protein
MTKTDNIWECPECYKEVDNKDVNNDDLELSYSELRKYMLKDNETTKAKIIEYLTYIGHDNITNDENLIKNYHDDLKQCKIPWKHELFQLK